MPPPTTPLDKKLTRALTLAKDLGLALIICYKMPSVLGLEGQVNQVTDILHQLVDHVEHDDDADLDAVDVAVERCFDILFEVQEVIEGFLDAENGRYLERG